MNNDLTIDIVQPVLTINGVAFDGSANITVADSTKLPLSGGTMTGAITLPNNTIGIKVGDDAALADRNAANTVFVEGLQNTDRGFINFSSTTGNFAHYCGELRSPVFWRYHSMDTRSVCTA